MTRSAYWLSLLALIAAPVIAEPVVKVALVGDVMLAESEGTGKLIARGGDPLAGVRPLLAGADLRVANFESSAGQDGRADPDKPYSFRTAPAGVAVFASLFNVAGVANNHAGDFGRADFVSTLATLSAAGVATFGGGAESRQAHKALIREHQGVKIAFLGYLDYFPRWFAAAPGMPGVAWLDERQAPLDIARARADGADVVVVMPHWGNEHEPLANDEQRRMARLLLDAGADAVIGGHPHVVQDYEVYRGKPILYSLGNFVFDGFDDDDNRHGWAVLAEVDRQGIRALRTHVVKMDDAGSPWPVSSRQGPCWQRGETQMSPCRMP